MLQSECAFRMSRHEAPEPLITLRRPSPRLKPGDGRTSNQEEDTNSLSACKCAVHSVLQGRRALQVVVVDAVADAPVKNLTDSRARLLERERPVRERAIGDADIRHRLCIAVKCNGIDGRRR